jgi:peptide deformylase
MSVATANDSILRQRAQEVGPDELASADTQRLIDELIRTRREAGGAGLAANQIWSVRRIAVVEVDEATRRRYPYKPPFPLSVIVNPTIEPLSEETLLINEGCLSIPGVRGDVERHVEVRVRFLDRHGERQELVARGLTAGTFQHEVDHLDGVLFTDRADPASLSTWEEFERDGMAEFLERVKRYT